MPRPADIAGASLHDVLIDLLLERGTPCMRLARLRECGLRPLIEYARANDIALQAYAGLERLQPGILDLDPEIAAHSGHMRRRAVLVASALSEFSRLATLAGRPVAIMKGAGVARFYPSGWIRVQRDIDAFVSDLDALFALWPELLSAGYVHEVVAVRHGSEAELEMSIAFVRSGERPGRIDVWMRSQPTSWWSARSIDSGFWARARPASDLPGLWFPAPQDAIAVLAGEVNERGQIRLRDVFDFCALAAQIEDDSWNACCEEIVRALPDAYNGLFEEACRQSGLPWPSKWPSIPRDEAILPRDISVCPKREERAAGIAALPAARFVQFVPVSNVSGPFAIADTDFGAALRTPFGTFLQR